MSGVEVLVAVVVVEQGRCVRLDVLDNKERMFVDIPQK